MAEIERYVCGLKREFGYLQPYMSPAERGRWVRHEDHALIAGDLRIELQLAENAREAAESRCKGLEEALRWIAGRPIPERNPDGDDQAAEAMRLTARTALEQEGAGDGSQS